MCCMNLAFSQIKHLAVDLKNPTQQIYVSQLPGTKERKSIRASVLCPEQEPKASVYTSVSPCVSSLNSVFLTSTLREEITLTEYIYTMTEGTKSTPIELPQHTSQKKHCK